MRVWLDMAALPFRYVGRRMTEQCFKPVMQNKGEPERDERHHACVTKYIHPGAAVLMFVTHFILVSCAVVGLSFLAFLLKLFSFCCRLINTKSKKSIPSTITMFLRLSTRTPIVRVGGRGATIANAANQSTAAAARRPTQIGLAHSAAATHQIIRNIHNTGKKTHSKMEPCRYVLWCLHCLGCCLLIVLSLPLLICCWNLLLSPSCSPPSDGPRCRSSGVTRYNYSRRT